MIRVLFFQAACTIATAIEVPGPENLVGQVHALQTIVDGFFDVLRFGNPSLDSRGMRLFCNESGAVREMEVNRLVVGPFGDWLTIRGPFLVARQNFDEELVSLTDEDIRDVRRLLDEAVPS